MNLVGSKMPKHSHDLEPVALELVCRLLTGQQAYSPVALNPHGMVASTHHGTAGYEHPLSEECTVL